MAIPMRLEGMNTGVSLTDAAIIVAAASKAGTVQAPTEGNEKGDPHAAQHVRGRGAVLRESAPEKVA